VSVLDRTIGRRGACLLFFALLDFLYALSLWRPPADDARNPTARFLASMAPLRCWAVLWFVVGVLCLAGVFRRRFGRIGFAAAIGIKTLWGAVFLLGWLAGVVARGWVAAVIWLAFAAMVGVLAGWPDPHPDSGPRR
jgi:O-antigen/teichoic acid export membrane protein